jgi:formylmethanofuran dehydrogenase subunit C
MVESVEVAKNRSNVSALSIGGRFKGYKPEEEKASRKAQVQETEVIRQLKEIWKAYRYDSKTFEGDYYDMVASSAKHTHYSAEDVQAFSIVLGEFQDEERFSDKVGLFLSALINNGEDDYYTLHTKHLQSSIVFIGFKNVKNITIKGNAGGRIGEQMMGGSIIIEGSVEDLVGISMKGGSIHIKENAGQSVGWGMYGGAIIVEGNAGRSVGFQMKGGSITICGDAHDAVGCNMRNGNITIKGNVGRSFGGVMKGGNIIVEGNTGDQTGSGMEGGSISVKGNAGDDVGWRMEGGEINLEGDYGSLGADLQGGKIYHKGELINGE